LDIANWDIDFHISNEVKTIQIAAPGTSERISDTEWHFNLPQSRDFSLSIGENYRLIQQQTTSGINVEFPFMMTTFYGGGAPDKGSRNSGRVANTEFESLSAQALAVSGAEGCELWKRAHQSLLKRADVVPISVGNRPFYTSKATLETVGLHAVPTSIRLRK